VGFQELADKIDYPKGTTDRFKRLDALERLWKGSIYDVLQWPFDKEENGPGNYIELHDRRPSVKYQLPKIIVDHTSSLTFGDAHAPAVRISQAADDVSPETLAEKHEQFERIIESLELEAVMLEAMQKGCVGSVAAVLRILPDKTPYIEIVEGKYCTPVFDVADPRKLTQMDQVYAVTAEDLRLSGYDGKYDDNKLYYIKVTYTKERVLASLPLEEKKFLKLGDTTVDETTGAQVVIRWEKDEERSYINKLGAINVVWMKNLPNRTSLDGECTFAAITDMVIEISYLMSQIGRGYRYTADPLMVEKSAPLQTSIPLAGSDPAAETKIIKSPARMLKVEGDMSVLEISGEGLRGAGDHVKQLREYAMETISGMKADSENSRGPTSGTALHMLHQALVWLVERFRTSYGVRGYLELLRMVLRGLVAGTIEIQNVDASKVDADTPLRLVWPQWSTPSGADMLAELQALSEAAGSTPQFPIPILPISVVAQKAASVVGISDQNRIAAELASEHKKNPPLTARDAHEADQKQQADQADKKHELDKIVTKGKVENDALIAKGKVVNDNHIAKAKAVAVAKPTTSSK
jgi:hypothetical protein